MVKAVFTVLLFLLLVILWPIVYWVSNYLWFGAISHVVVHELVLFLPMGAVGALGVIIPLFSKRYEGQLMSGMLGYLVATPIAYLASLYGGLILPPWLATAILGGVPLLVFTFIGYKIGEKVHSHNQGVHHY